MNMGGCESGKITRREALSKMGRFTAGAAAASILGQLGCDASDQNTRRPNIILIVADDLGYGDPGCYGGTLCDTPNLDKMAHEGVRLTDFYVSTPVCAPTRVSLMTGKFPQRTSLPNIPDYKNPKAGLSPDETTIAELLRKVGYHTGLVGKWHLGYAPKFRPLRQGFDEFYGFLSGWLDYNKHTYNDETKWMFRNDEPFDEPGYTTDLFTREAISFIDRHKNQPFFLYLPYNAPHEPLEAPEEWMKRSRNGVYGAVVACMDDSIGKVLNRIKEHGLDDNTLVIFMSDNGNDGKGTNAPLQGQKRELWEGGIRVPAIIRWPGHIPAGEVVREPIISMDWFNTIAGAAGVCIPKSLNVDGKDILPVLKDKKKSPHDIIFWQFFNQSAVRQGEFKLLREENKPDRLFNLVKDLGEKNDLAAKNPALAKKLSAALDKWLKELKGNSYG